MKVKFLILICLYLYINTYSQKNMVYDPSFEGHMVLPCDFIKENVPFKMRYWDLPTGGTSDIYSTKVDKKCYTYISRKNPVQKNYPRTGEIMLGFYAYKSSYREGISYREYVQGKLRRPISAGKTYQVEFWVSLKSDKSKLASNNIGIYFSNKKIKTDNWKVLKHTPQINEIKIIYTKNGEWYKISGTFVAEYSARYIIIGNFFNDNETSTKLVSRGNKEHIAYYYIDDIAVYETKTEQIQIVQKEQIDKNIEMTSKSDSILVFKKEKYDDYEIGQKIILKNIFFEFDKTELLPESYTELDNLCYLLNTNSKIKIEIGGHTDNVGSDNYNINLSNNRAKAVADYLILQGIIPSRIKCAGYGRKIPISDNISDEGRSKNRRVEFVILEK